MVQPFGTKDSSFIAIDSVRPNRPHLRTLSDVVCDPAGNWENSIVSRDICTPKEDHINSSVC